MLTQLETVRARLGLTELETQWDALLTNTIAAVSERFDRECDRTFARTENLSQEFCAGDTHVALRCTPVETVTRFDLKRDETEGWVEQAGVKFLIRRSCALRLGRRLGSDNEQARVIYTGGYVLPGNVPSGLQTALPREVEHAATEQVCWWFQNRERLGLTRLWEYHGTYRHFGDLDLLTSTRAVLQRYARVA